MVDSKLPLGYSMQLDGWMGWAVVFFSLPTLCHNETLLDTQTSVLIM